MRRAARLGDGWIHAGGDPVAPLIARLNALRNDYGCAREPFEIHVLSFAGYSVDEVHRLEDLGVTDITVAVRDVYDRSTDRMSLAEKLDALHAHADRLISRV